MKNLRCLLKTVVCILIIVSLSGCWNSRELNDLGIVLGVAIDKSDEPDLVTVTAQTIKPGQMASGKKDGGNGQKSYVNFKDKGHSVFAALRDITNQSSRKLYFPHNQVLVIGKSAAEDGVAKYLDFFTRDPETRLSVLVVVAKDSAQEILDSEPELEKIPANNITMLVEDQALGTSQTMRIRLNDFKKRLLSKTTAPVAPMVELYEDDGKKKAEINGTAVFKNGKLVGTLNKREGRGLLWVLGKVESTIIETYSSQGYLVGLETVRAEGKFSPELDGEKIKIKIDITEEGNIGEQYGPEGLSDLHEVAFLELQKAEVIKSDVMAVVKKAQELNTDVFGFGDAVHRKYPEEWTSMEDKWDEIFPKIEVEVNVDANLRLMGRIRTPSVPQ